MGLTDDVREHCAEVAASAELVTIDVSRLDSVEPGPPPALDPRSHYLDGTPEEVALFTLELDAINFGSGWFPTIRKRPGCSGSITIARALTEHGPWPIGELPRLDAAAVATVLGQDPGHELMDLYARALRELGAFLAGRSALGVVAEAGGSAEALAAQLAAGMPMFADVGFYKRAQITPADLALAGVASFGDLDRLTIFADNLVPHVLRVDGVLVYDHELARSIDAGELLPPGAAEQEIRACAVHACELLAPRLGVPPRTLDNWLWNRGRGPRFKAVPRHRTRTTAY
ncbi:MAG TPA: queuosine salvage family protein [Thermoleophilaceae bacterium]|nr:queuosine salvage family protein [Thermoleophilaceae bacterium]